MKGKRTDIETKAKIISEKIKNPDLSTRDIANSIGDIDNTTVNDIINQNLPQLPTQSVIIAEIVSNDMESVRNMSIIAKRFTQKIVDQEELDRSDIQVANTAVTEAFKRSQLFQGKATDRFDINTVTEEQAKKIVSLYANP